VITATTNDHQADLIVPKYVISDTHFGHNNILKYEPCRLKWGATIDEMNEAMVAAWNSVVKSDDWVLHVGDFAMGSKDNCRTFRQRLNGKVLIVLGNHDRKSSFMRECGFDVVVDSYEMTLPNGKRLLVKHDPAHFDLNLDTPDTVYLHGHTHGAGVLGTLPVGRSKCACIEVIPTSPAPVLFADLLVGP